jgi:hypothetical protein
MSERPAGNLLKCAALIAAAVLTLGSTTAAAFAQDDPATSSTPPAPAETSTPVPTSETPPPTAEPEVQRQNSVNGVLYADKNDNGQQDPGEAVSGGEVTVVGGPDSTEHKTTSGADGKFAFPDLAAGTYRAAYRLDGGWVVHHVKATGDLITVTDNATTEVTARAERPYSEQLRAIGVLGYAPYERDASATVALTLTNTTNRKISGIQARCDRKGSPRALGRGSGWNVLRGDGIALEAGQQRVLIIIEEIPQAARDEGVVTLDCDVAPNVEWNTDGPVVHDVAMVNAGTGGGYTMLLGEDRNADERIDAGEATGGVEVVLLSLNDGAQVAKGTSGVDGRIVFTGLNIGEYRAVPLGSWGFRVAGQEIVRITPQGGTEVKFLKSAPPADLRITAKFEKPHYGSHEMIRLDLTVTNVGGQTAERVTRSGTLSPLFVFGHQGGDLDQYRGARIPAGESRTFSWQGSIREIRKGKIAVSGSIERLGGRGTGFYAQTDVEQTFGDINGVVYIDRNHNEQQDPGEEAADTVVEANGGVPYGYLTTKTDANGRYSFKNIPSGDWWIGYTQGGGWIVHDAVPRRPVHVEPGKPAEVIARAERPYAEALSASTVFDKADYAIGEEVKITVTLRNKADYAIKGITAYCGDTYNNHLGSEPMVDSWGDLRPYSRGVTLNARETKTFVVNEKVPEGAKWSNKVVVSCTVGPGAGAHDDAVHTFDWASVAGGVGSLSCALAQDKNGNFEVDPGEGIPHTRVALMTDRENGALIAETVSNAEGYVHIAQVPPGAHWAVVDGPWKFAYEDGGLVEVYTNHTLRCFAFVVPGPYTAPEPDGGTPGDDVGGGTGGALAKTGASVLGLGALAVLLVGFGFGARAAGRRR